MEKWSFDHACVPGYYLEQTRFLSRKSINLLLLHNVAIYLSYSITIIYIYGSYINVGIVIDHLTIPQYVHFILIVVPVIPC